jgi:hypothetical protein
MNISKTLARFSNQLRALWKFCLSFCKRDWGLSDYPVVFRTQEPDPASDYDSPRFKLQRQVASIVNWHLTGGGDTRKEALQKLRSTFAAVQSNKKETGESLPRPGTRVPIEFATQERVNAHAELSEDFDAEETNDALCARIKEIYGVDVSDIKSVRLCEIFDRIVAARKPE